MINVVRIILLIIALGVVSLVGFYFYKVKDNKVEIGNVKVKILDEGVDVEIENFKVTHEVKGKKEWILKAGLAQVNNNENVTRLKNVEMILPEGVSGNVEGNTSITLESADKQQVGEFAAQIRRVRPPEPYKGKGIRYADEYVKIKAGKTAA